MISPFTFSTYGSPCGTYAFFSSFLADFRFFSDLLKGLFCSCYLSFAPCTSTLCDAEKVINYEFVASVLLRISVHLFRSSVISWSIRFGVSLENMSLGTLAQGLQLRYHLHFSKSDRATCSHYISFCIVMYWDTSPWSLNIMSLIWIMDIVKHELQTGCHWNTHGQLFIQDTKYMGNACKRCTGTKKTNK